MGNKRRRAARPRPPEEEPKAAKEQLEALTAAIRAGVEQFEAYLEARRNVAETHATLLQHLQRSGGDPL